MSRADNALIRHGPPVVVVTPRSFHSFTTETSVSPPKTRRAASRISSASGVTRSRRSWVWPNPRRPRASRPAVVVTRVEAGARGLGAACRGIALPVRTSRSGGVRRRRHGRMAPAPAAAVLRPTINAMNLAVLIATSGRADWPSLAGISDGTYCHRGTKLIECARFTSVLHVQGPGRRRSRRCTVSGPTDPRGDEHDPTVEELHG